MSETSEKYEDILQYEIEALKEIRQNWLDRAEEDTRHIALIRGTMLGLTLGIGGNLFVQCLYPVTEALFLGECKPTFVGNLIVCAISLIFIVFVATRLRRQLTRYENKLKPSRESAAVIEYAIQRRQHSLEQRQKNSNRGYDNDTIQEQADTVGDTVTQNRNAEQLP
jgi:hypothetical protein